MSSAGADGSTLQEMGKALHIAKPRENIIHEQASVWTKELISLKSIELKTANRLWIDTLFIPEESFKLLMEKDYGAGFAEVNFLNKTEAARKEINAWVERQTDGYIKDLLHPEDVTGDTRLILTNAVYFKGTWQKPFDPEDTRPAPFTSSDGSKTEKPLMHFTEYLPYFESSEYQAIKLDYKGKETSMILVLPSKKAWPQLDAAGFQKLCSRLEGQDVEVSLPRFETEQRVEMVPMLEKLGMKSAFTTDADFKRLSEGPGIKIGNVVHQAFIKISEDGTKAAAATAILAPPGGSYEESEEKPKIFNANHPFLFFIIHNPTGGILFMGRVDNPKKLKLSAGNPSSQTQQCFILVS